MNIPVFGSFVYFGWQQELIPLVLTGILTMVIKFWFIDRMVILYENNNLKIQLKKLRTSFFM